MASRLRRGAECDSYWQKISRPWPNSSSRGSKPMAMRWTWPPTEMKCAVQTRYDALLMDVMLPVKDDITVVRQLRRQGNQTPVLFLPGRIDVEDRIRGLDAGGDDCLPEPFHLEEPLARLRAILRRQRSDTSLLLRVADLELDSISHVARRAGQEIPLTPREFALLELLMTSSPRPVNRTTITEKVWDQHFDPGTNVLNVYVSKLRQKLNLPGTVPLLQTVRGTGFALLAEVEKPHETPAKE